MYKSMITTALLLFVTLFSNAQTSGNDNGQIIKSKPVVTKGYYSIYRNHEKLNKGKTFIPVTPKDELLISQAHHKGYYSIGDNHTEVHKQGKSFIAITPRRPVSHKGYYSVGRPAIKPLQVDASLEAFNSHTAPEGDSAGTGN